MVYFNVDYDGEVVADVDFFQILQRELQILFGLALHEVPLRVVSAPRRVVHSAALQLSTCAYYAITYKENLGNASDIYAIVISSEAIFFFKFIYFLHQAYY